MTQDGYRCRTRNLSTMKQFMKDRKHLPRHIIFVMVLCLLTTLYIMDNARRKKKSSLPRPDYSKKVILSWNSFFGTTGFMEPNLEELGCVVTGCRVSTNRALLDISDAVVFHWHDAKLEDLPPVKTLKQRWVLMTFEPPMFAPPEVLTHLSPFIDWTATYRMDSDIPSPYGLIRPRKPGVSGPVPAVPSPDELTRRQPLAWMTSDCITRSRREQLAAKLTKLIPIRVYGTCSGDRSLRDVPADEAFDFLAKRYVFYLSFENSVCKDYITEKAFQPLYHGLIPLVYGGADYQHHLPVGSYIDVLDFKTTEELARHLYRVMGNWTLYASYFDWRRDQEVTQRACSNGFFCDVCAKLHQETSDWTSETRNLTHWWYEKRDCVHPENGRLKMSRKMIIKKKRKWYKGKRKGWS